MGIFDAIASIGAGIMGMEQAEADRKLSLQLDAENRMFNAKEAEKNRAFQTEERLATQAYNESMWQKNNEYNSLSAQIQRAKEAGISPNAIVGGQYTSPQSSPVTSSPQSGSQASYSSSLPSGILGQSPAMMTSISQLASGASQSILNMQEYQEKKETFDERKKAFALDNIIKDSTNKEILSKVGLNNVSIEAQLQAIEIIEKKSPLELKIMNEELNNLLIQYKEKEANIKLIDAQTETEKERKELVDAQTETEKERKELVEAQTYTEISKDGLLEEQITAQEIQNEMQEFRNVFSKLTGIPIDTPEFAFTYDLWKNGSWLDYCNHITNMFNENFAKSSGSALGNFFGLGGSKKKGVKNPNRKRK